LIDVELRVLELSAQLSVVDLNVLEKYVRGCSSDRKQVSYNVLTSFDHGSGVPNFVNNHIHHPSIPDSQCWKLTMPASLYF
jgi:hypothetical protein